MERVGGAVIARIGTIFSCIRPTSHLKNSWSKYNQIPPLHRLQPIRRYMTGTSSAAVPADQLQFGRRDALVAGNQVTISLGGGFRGTRRRGLEHGYGLPQLCKESTSKCKLSCLHVKPVQVLKLGRKRRETEGKRNLWMMREKRKRRKGYISPYFSLLVQAVCQAILDNEYEKKRKRHPLHRACV